MTGPDSAESYSIPVLEHFFEPHGAGRLPAGPRVIEVRVGERRLGMELELGLDIDDGRIRDARFRAFGCPYLIAAASDLVSCAHGQSLQLLASWSWRDQADRLAVPAERYGRLLLVEDAVRAALRRATGTDAPPGTVP